MITRSDFAELVEGAAQRLLASGLVRGDVVAVAARNGLELAVAQFACARAYLVLCGLNIHQAPALWDYLLRSSGASLVLAQAEFVAGLPGAEDAAAVLLAGPKPWAYDAARDQPDEAATYCLVHTSGTTGRPKASRVVHRCSVHAAMTYAHLLDLRPDDVSAVLFPLYYVAAMHAHLLLRRREVSTEALPALRRVAMGGSPWPPGMEQALREQLPSVTLYDVYGRSETHSPATLLDDA